MSKTCPKCGKEKSETKFHMTSKRAHPGSKAIIRYRRNVCAECTNIARRSPGDIKLGAPRRYDPIKRVAALDRCCERINRLLKKRFDDFGSFQVYHCKNWPSHDFIRGKVCVWAPREELSYPEALELLEALEHLWR